jgi:hypothetical protein
MTAGEFRTSSELTVGRGVKWAGAPVSTGLGPEISEIHDQIESSEKKIKTLTAKFEAEVKGIADRITKKIEVDTELFVQREQHQLENQALQAQHVQETQLLQDQLESVLAAPSGECACAEAGGGRKASRAARKQAAEVAGARFLGDGDDTVREDAPAQSRRGAEGADRDPRGGDRRHRHRCQRITGDLRVPELDQIHKSEE